MDALDGLELRGCRVRVNVARDKGQLLVDATEFILRDSHGVADRLKQMCFSQSGTAVFVAGGAIGLLKCLKNQCLFLLRDTDASVRYADGNGALGLG